MEERDVSSSNYEYDVFICHASEDKEEIVRPLAKELKRRRLDVWFDEFELKLGDSLREKIDHGLGASNYGIVVFSEAFFQKDWAEYELNGLVARQNQGDKMILPLWFDIGKEEIIDYSPPIADLLATEISQDKIRDVALEIKNIVSESNFNNITDYRGQQQRLEILNRIFRHNIRTETNLILGYAEKIDNPVKEKIIERAYIIDEMGQSNRKAIELFQLAREERSTQDIDTMLKDIINSAENAYSDTQFQYSGPGENCNVQQLLDIVVEEAIENAAEHNTNENPLVRINANQGAEIVDISIVDNGPSIDQYELEVLSEGKESPIIHGSGVGLWIIKWGTQLVSGDLQIGQSELGGTKVDITVPKEG